MSSTKFSDDFKRDAVAQITERGYPVRARQATAGREKSVVVTHPGKGSCFTRRQGDGGRNSPCAERRTAP